MIMTSGHPVYDPEPSPDGAHGTLIYTHLVPRALDLLHPSQRSIRADLYVMTWDGVGAPSVDARSRADAALPRARDREARPVGSAA